VDQAGLAGLLHDCAKCMPLAEMQEVAKEHRLLVDREVLQSENLLHAYAGAALAESVYGVKDYAVLAAIRCHTTGRIGMLPLDMALYLADKIEPSRRSYPVLEELRRLSYEGRLLEAMRYSLGSTVEYVKKNKGRLHGATLRTAQWLDHIHAEWQKKQSRDN
jgi:predicted HD superfamily hydrolase involved in NAD metabolism